VTIAGRLVELKFAGPDLAALLMRAISHLECAGGEPALTICVADAESSGVCPCFEYRPLGTPRVDDALSVRVPDSRVTYHFEPRLHLGFCWFDRARPESWDLASPFRQLFSWWAECLGAQLAHAAVVGNGHTGVMLAGPGGSGKSTLTLACLRRGLQTLGDDYVWMEPERAWVGHSLYCTVKLTLDDWRDHSEGLRSKADQVAHEKVTAFIPDSFAKGVTSSLAVRAVATLRIVDDRAPRIRDARAMQVLTALAPSSLLQLRGSGPSGLVRLARLVHESRTLLFEAGSDYEANADAIAELVGDLSRAERHVFPSMGAWS
jgi:hypothetical protein